MLLTGLCKPIFSPFMSAHNSLSKKVDIGSIQGVAEGAGAPPWRLTATISLFS